MSTRYNITAKQPMDTFENVVSLNDVVEYEFDATGWEADNADITSATWTVESGSATVSGQAVTDGVVSALVTYNQAGRVLISVLLNTATVKKKLWLVANVKDREIMTDDYGFNA